MAIGTVKWFNNAKGFGFITPEGGGEDVFAHFSAIVMDGYRTLEEGMKVQYKDPEGGKPATSSAWLDRITPRAAGCKATGSCGLHPCDQRLTEGGTRKLSGAGHESSQIVSDLMI